MGRSIIILTLVFNTLTTFAQDSLSLSDAIQRGLENNFQIKIAENSTKITAANNNWSEAGKGPTVSLIVKQQQIFNDNRNPAAFLKGQILTAGTTPTVNANWILFNGYGVNITKQQLELLEEQSKQNASLIVENVAQAIVLSYYRCVLEDEKLMLLTEVLNKSREQKQLALEKKKLGILTSFDYIQIENTFLDDSTNYLLSKANTENAVRNLNMVLASPMETRYLFIDTLTAAPNVADINTIETTMLSDNSQLKKEFINSQLIQNESKLYKTALYPLITMDVGLSSNLSVLAPLGDLKTELQDDFNTTQNIGLGGSYQAYINFTLAWTLFDGKNSRRNIQEAIWKMEAAELSVQDIKQNMSNDIRKKHALYTTQKQITSVSEKKKQTSALSNELGYERWKNGLLSSFEYRSIQLNHLNSELLLKESYFNQWANYLEISRLTGGILKEIGME